MTALSDESKGSTWHKWDLHIHTPSSFDYGEKNLRFADLADYLNKSHIDAFAVTDHWNVDGFFELKPFISPEKLLLPGIELRIDKTSKQKSSTGGTKTGILHALVFFPEGTTKDDIERKFLHHICLCERKNKYLVKKDIIEIGMEVLSAGLPDEDYYAAGCEQAYADYQQITESAKTLNGLVCLTYDKYGGFERIDPVQDSIFKSNLVKDCDLIETSKDDVRRAFFENEKIIKACGKKTPCFRGSDAHKPDEIGRSYTWIKAAKSFEGLRQIIYFPKERVSFSADRPLYSYPRIKNIEFHTLKDSHCLAALDSKIEFSENLTSIIGHPSIGKSTFVEALAYLFGSNSEQELTEGQTKIEHIQEVNPELIVSASVARGSVVNEIQRDFCGEYDGSITKDEFTVTYLNQGYIDRTARDPGAVSELIARQMDTSKLDEVRDEMDMLKERLEECRKKYLKKFSLLEEQEALKGKLAEVKKVL